VDSDADVAEGNETPWKALRTVPSRKGNGARWGRRVTLCRRVKPQERMTGDLGPSARFRLKTLKNEASRLNVEEGALNP
jgi:hypothetical protein